MVAFLDLSVTQYSNPQYSPLPMRASFLAAINQICSEKNVKPDQVLEAVKQAIATAYRKDFGNKEQEIRVDFEEGKDMPTILLVKEVVEDVENDNFEISIKDAQRIKPDAEPGDEIAIDVTPIEYGRIATQAAKQVILQKLQEAEKQSLYEMFKDREEELLTATVTKVDPNWVTLEIEGMTVSLPWREQIPGEHYYTGKRLRVYLDRVELTGKGPQLRISRTHQNLVKKLLELEIPEVRNGDVEIKGIARDAGFRSKVAVKSNDPRIDPIGACVGQKGVRIQAVKVNKYPAVQRHFSAFTTAAVFFNVVLGGLIIGPHLPPELKPNMSMFIPLAHAETCGDGVPDEGEACDDGNTANGDYCSADCQTITGSCSDSVVQSNEACDDGNVTDGDYCNSTCTAVTTVCGDSLVQGAEACDDGNTADGDYCNASCTAVTGSCGDGSMQTGEACDDGNAENGDMCTSSCTLNAPGTPNMIAASDTGISDTDNITNVTLPTFLVSCYPGATVQLRYFSDPASDTAVCGMGGTVELTANSGHNQFAARQDTGGTPSDLSGYEYMSLDTTAPSNTGSNPSTLATDVDPNPTLSLTFDSEVYPVEGKKLSIRKVSDNSIVEEMNVDSEQVTGGGSNTISILRSVPLVIGERYFVYVEGGAFTDVAGNGFGGFSDATPWNFWVTSHVSCGGIINNPGTYTLASDITTSGSRCITITSDGVTIEGNGHTINGSAGGTAIYAVGNAYDVTVQNVTITGFDTAVDTSADTDAHTAGSITLDTVTATGEAITATGTGTPYNSFSTGGNVSVTDSTVGSIDTTGGDASNDAAAGGNVTVTNSTVGNIVTSGGAGYRAGTPGTVDILDSIAGNIDTHGVDSYVTATFAYGAAVTITNSTTGTVNTSGGNSTVGNAAAGGDVTVVTSTTGNITVDGGDAAEFGGNAGTLDIDDASSVGVLSCAGGTGNTPGTGCTPLSIVSVTPADNATGVGAEPTLSITFDHAVVFNAGGVLTILENGGATEIITLPDERITGDGTDTVSVDPSRPMGAGNVVSIQITGNTFRTSYSGFSGIPNNTTWNFTIDGDVPTTPVSAPDLKSASDNGLSNTDNITNDSTPTFHIASCTTGNTITLYKDGSSVGTASCSGGSADVTASTLTGGTYSFTYTEANNIGESDPSPSLSVTIDLAAPTVALSASQTSPTNSSTINMTAQFSETVTGFVIGDITVTNGTKGSFSAVDGDTYTFNITFPSGTVTADIAGAVATDTAGNSNTAASQFSIVYDNTAPALSTAAVNGTSLTLTYDGALDGTSVPDTTDFEVEVNGTPVVISSAHISSATVTLTLASAVEYGQTVTLSYTAGTHPLQDATPNQSSDLLDQIVTNNTSSGSSSSAESSSASASPVSADTGGRSGGSRGGDRPTESGPQSSMSGNAGEGNGASANTTPTTRADRVIIPSVTSVNGTVRYDDVNRLLNAISPLHAAAPEEHDALAHRLRMRGQDSALRGVVIGEILSRFNIPLHTWNRAPFDDVPLLHPQHDTIATARSVGLVTGYLNGDGTSMSQFRPDKPISTQELSILMRRLRRLGFMTQSVN